jgi:hypothetical protein
MSNSWNPQFRVRRLRNVDRQVDDAYRHNSIGPWAILLVLSLALLLITWTGSLNP